MNLVIILSLILTVSAVYSDLLFDSTGGDPIVSFRKSPCFNSADEMDYIFYGLTNGPAYKKWQRPGYNDNNNGSTPLQVNISLDMNSLASVDDLNSEYKVMLKMEMEWFDKRLVFDCKDQLIMMSISPDYLHRLWYPSLGVPNIKEAGSTMLDGQANVEALRVRSDGYVFIKLRFQLNLFCQLNFKQYPFDQQMCSIKFESRALSEEQLVLTWHSVKPFRNGENFLMTGFQLIDYELSNESVKIIDIHETDKVSRLKVMLHLQREWHYFLLDVYLPSSLFVMMSWLSFWLEISAAPARVTLGMTTMLTLVTSSMSVREKLPKVSYVHALDIWISFCIVSVFASLIEFAVVSYIFRSEKNRRQRVKSLQRDLCELSFGSMTSSNDPLIAYSTHIDIPEKPINNNLNNEYLTVGNLSDNLRRVSYKKNICLGSKNLCFNSKTCSGKSLKNLLEIDSSNELADDIDRKCRILFPLCFSVFNIIYWTSV